MKILQLFILTASISLSPSPSFAKNNPSILELFSNAIISKQKDSDGFADVVEKLLPAVVNISTSQEIESRRAIDLEDFFGALPPEHSLKDLEDLLKNNQEESEKREVSSLGSGFIISKDGYIVTNYHVIEGADEIEITLSDSNKFQAKVIGTDKRTDLALLKIDANYDLNYVKFGDSSKSRIGQWVIAIGNPFGLGGSVSAGIISARGRDINSGPYDDFIQTDAAINKGNSGGPLFNMKGQVIGVATAIFSPSGGNVGIGFATPSSTATSVINQLKEQGEVVRGWLGVSIQNVSEEMSKAINMEKPMGAFVSEVVEDSPAQQAGIIATDIIIEFDNKKIKEVKDLSKIVSSTPVNKEVEIVVLRRGSKKTLITRVEKMKNEDLEKENKKDLQKPSLHLLEMGLIEKDNEVIIVQIKKNSPAAKKGIKNNDIILSANQIPVQNIKDLRTIIQDAKNKKKDKIFLFIKRNISKNKKDNPIRSISFAVILPLGDT